MSTALQYQLLENALNIFTDTNIGSRCFSEFNVIDGTFERLFFAHASAAATIYSIPPVFSIGGAFRKSVNKGILLTLTAINSVGSIEFLAFAIVRSESGSNWRIFLENVAIAIPHLTTIDFLLFSDRSTGLCSIDLLSIFPQAHRTICAKHLQRNVCAHLRSHGHASLWNEASFWLAVSAATKDDFDIHMQAVSNSNEAAFTYLQHVNPDLWSLWAIPLRRYGIKTTNSCESLNAALRNARKLPILDLVYFLAEYIMQKRVDTKNDLSKLVDKARWCIQQLQSLNLTQQLLHL